MDDDTITMRVTRWRPDKNTPPGPQEYDVPLRKEWTVLDGLNHIKNELDQTLAFRWSCRMGICGSCGMNVNGEPRLSCGAFLSDYAPGPVVVEPLANFPIARDLVVDMTDFMEKLPRVKPWIIRDDDVTEIFSPRGADSSFMFVAVCGIRRRASAQETEASMRFYKQQAEES